MLIPKTIARTLNYADKVRLNKRLIEYITLSNVPFRIVSNLKLYALLDKVFPSVSNMLIKTYYIVAKHIRKEHNFY